MTIDRRDPHVDGGPALAAVDLEAPGRPAP